MTTAGVTAAGVTAATGEPPLVRRRGDLERLANESWDLLVVGGGITGAGAALDAASRGLRVALVERADIASGTSSRSSRLIHGGLRYLEHLRFGLVREALSERSRLQRLAPHLVRLEPLLFPLYGGVLARPFYDSGLTIYDLLGAARDGGRHRHVSAREALEISPALRRAGLRGGLVYHDAVEDDARFALAVARTARDAGATVATRVRVDGAIHERDRAVGARARDALGGASFDIRARAIIDATGVWSGRPDGAFPAREPAPPASAGAWMRPSRGTHLVVPRERIPSSVGLTMRAPGRSVFLVPWPGFWVIGTTDLADDRDPDAVAPTAEDVDEIVGSVNEMLDVDLTRSDVVAAYAGLRPLVGGPAAADGSMVRASREHRVVIEADGLIRIVGGKFTTYRLMARDAVDAALDVAFDAGTARARPTTTGELPLTGSAARADLDRQASEVAALIADHGLERRHADRLVARHGTQAGAVARLGIERDLLRPIAPTSDHLEAEIVWAALEELALGVDDVLARRTRLAQELPDRAASIAPSVARVLGGELGWDAAREAEEVARFVAGAHRDFDVPGKIAAR